MTKQEWIDEVAVKVLVAAVRSRHLHNVEDAVEHVYTVARAMWEARDALPMDPKAIVEALGPGDRVMFVLQPHDAESFGGEIVVESIPAADWPAWLERTVAEMRDKSDERTCGDCRLLSRDAEDRPSGCSRPTGRIGARSTDPACPHFQPRGAASPPTPPTNDLRRETEVPQ